MDPHGWGDPYSSAPVRYPTTSYAPAPTVGNGAMAMGADTQRVAGGNERTSQWSSARGGNKPVEVPGAPAGNVRYRCVMIPVTDGDDIEDVIAQVGLDGVKLLAGGDAAVERRAYALTKVAKWGTTDPTILRVVVKDVNGDKELALSGDAGTISAMMDVLTTSAFQWCELNGHDAMDTIVSAGSEWTNRKATEQSADAGALAIVQRVAGINFWEAPEYSGWLTKQGEHIRTWRKRWFVLKEGYLVWYKTNVVNERSVTRGTIPLHDIESVSVASDALVGKPYAIQLGGALATRIGAQYLVADSERERAQWIEALHKAIHDQRNTTQGGGVSSSSEQLRQGFAQAAQSPSAPGPAATRTQNFTDTSNIRIQVPSYASPSAQPHPQPQASPGTSYVTLPALPFAHPSSAAGAQSFTAPPAAPGSEYYSNAYSAPPDLSDWTTYHTPEGKPYYYNSKTGVTSWNPPR
jgi:hypothetical protein